MPPGAEGKGSLRPDLIGGATTFVTMAYIVVVNPAILAAAGIPVGPSTVATILTAVFGCLLMGLYARRPIAVAPYMGENAFIAFGLAFLHVTWQQRLGSVFVSGAIFLVITLLKIRPWLARAISPSLKYSFAVGIGFFLAMIGLNKAGIVTSFVRGLPAAALTDPGTGLLHAPDVPLKIGDLRDPTVLLALFGFVVITVLMVRRVRGAILWGIVATALAGGLLGQGRAPDAIMAMPFTGDYSLAPVAFQLDLAGVLRFSFLPILFTLFMMSFLDTLGTLVGLGAAGEMLDAKGDFPDIDKPMLVNAVTCMFSGLVGTSTSGAYIESAAGIRDGARTGLAAIVTGLLFAVALFFIPLFEPLQTLAWIYAPALIAVGLSMVALARRIDFEDFTELAPAFVTIVMMTFTFNIANGLTAGLILHPLLKLAAGRVGEINAGGLVLAVLSAGYYLFGLPH